MKKLKYLLMLGAFFLMSNVIHISSLHAESDVQMILSGALVRDSGQAKALNKLHLEMTYQGTPIQSAIALHYDGEIREAGYGTYNPPDLECEFYTSSSLDSPKAGLIYVSGRHTENGVNINGESNRVPLVLFTKNETPVIQVESGSSITYRGGNLDCGSLSASTCYLSYEAESSAPFQVNAQSGEIIGSQAGSGTITTYANITSVSPIVKQVVKSETITVSDNGNTPAPELSFDYERESVDLVEGYSETNIGKVTSSIPSLSYTYEISDCEKFSIDAQGKVYIKTGLSANTYPFHIDIYDSAHTLKLSTVNGSITINPAPSNKPKPKLTWLKMKEANDSGWYQEALTLECSDIASTYSEIKLDDGSYKTSQRIDQDGIHKLKITFRDPTTLQESEPLSLTIKIDTHKPIIEQITQDSSNPTKFNITASDKPKEEDVEYSGINNIHYTIYQRLDDDTKRKVKEDDGTIVNDAINITYTQAGKLELCAYASDISGFDGEESCSLFTIKEIDTKTSTLQADTNLGSVKYSRGFPEGTIFSIKDITKENSVKLDSSLQVKQVLKLSLGSFNLEEPAEFSLQIDQAVSLLKDKEYYIETDDKTLIKINPKENGNMITFETKKLGNLIIAVPKQKDDVSGTLNPSVNTGDHTQPLIYLMLICGSAMICTFLFRNRSQHIS